MLLVPTSLQKRWWFSEKSCFSMNCWLAKRCCNFFPCKILTQSSFLAGGGTAKWKFIGKWIFNAAREGSWLRWILELVMNVHYQGRGIWGVNFPGSNHLIRLLSVTPSPVIYLTQSFTPPLALPGEWSSQVVCMTSSPGLSGALRKMLGVNWSSWSWWFPMFSGWGAELLWAALFQAAPCVLIAKILKKKKKKKVCLPKDVFLHQN